MISKKEEAILAVALTNERIGKEVAARIIDGSSYPSTAQAILDTIDNSKKIRDQIKEYLIVSTTDEKIGCEISEQLDLVVEILEYQSINDPINDADLALAQAKQKPLSEEAKEYLTVALGDDSVGESIFSQINTSISSTSNVTAVRIPTSSILNSTQRAAFPLGVTTDVLTVSCWLKFNPADTSQMIFILDAEGVPFGLWYDSIGAILSFNWGGTVQNAKALDAFWHHYVCVYDNVADEATLYVDGLIRGLIAGQKPATLVGGVTFTPEMVFRMTSYDDADDSWFFDGKIANFEIWTDVLGAADALALYKHGYYQDPEAIVSKSLLTHFQMGDNPGDNITTIIDSKGTSDTNWVDKFSAPSSVVFDSDVPAPPPPRTPVYPYTTDLSLIQPWESLRTTIDANHITSVWPPTGTRGFYVIVPDFPFATDMVLDYDFLPNFDTSKDLVFTFDITEYTPPTVSDTFEVRMTLLTTTESLGFIRYDLKTFPGVANNITLTISSADLISDGVIDSVIGVEIRIFTDGTLLTEATITMENLTITNA